MTTPARPSKPPQGAARAGGTTGIGPVSNVPLASQHRLTQALLAAQLIQDVLALWLVLDLSHIRTSWVSVEAAIMGLVRSAAAQSVLYGTDYYASAREIAGLAGDITLTEPPHLDLNVVSDILTKTGPGSLLHDIKIGKQLAQALSDSGARMAGQAGNAVNRIGRETVQQLVQEDPKAIGWARKLGPRPCFFCSMLASRGPVYKTRKSASFLAHGNCMCTAVPGFRKKDLSLPENNYLQKLWQKVTKGLSGKNAVNAWRQYWIVNGDHEMTIAQGGGLGELENI